MTTKNTRSLNSSPSWLKLHMAAVFAFLYLPIAVLILYSFNGPAVGGFPPTGLTLNWYRELFSDSAMWDAVLNSLIVAACAVLIGLLVGTPAALALDRVSFPGKALFRRLVLLPLILPGIITGLSLLMLWVAVGMKLSLWSIAFGHGTALISVATTEIFAGLQKFDRAQEEASLDLGANYFQTLFRVTLPNLKLPIIGAALLMFTLSMDEIAVTFFPDWARQHVAARDLVALASRHDAGNQCHLHHHLSVFTRNDFVLVSPAHAQFAGP